MYIYYINHFFLMSFFSTDLITPTATVYFISLTANLPSGGYSEKTSTAIGLVGINLTIAESPDLINLGSSSITFAVLLSILDMI